MRKKEWNKREEEGKKENKIKEKEYVENISRRIFQFIISRRKFSDIVIQLVRDYTCTTAVFAWLVLKNFTGEGRERIFL